MDGSWLNERTNEEMTTATATNYWTATAAAVFPGNNKTPDFKLTQQQQNHLTEIMEVLADGKITMEEALPLFKEWEDGLPDDTDKMKIIQDVISSVQKDIAQVKAETAALANKLRNLGESN